jgi:hypothetical protein
VVADVDSAIDTRGGRGRGGRAIEKRFVKQRSGGMEGYSRNGDTVGNRFDFWRCGSGDEGEVLLANLCGVLRAQSKKGAVASGG